MGKWGDYFDILRDVVWGKTQFLDLYEQTTLFFILRRTWYWGKEWEFIPLRHFTNGIWTKDGDDCVTPPIRISETKLIQAIKSLEGKCIIEIDRKVARTSRYRIRRWAEIDDHKIFEYIVLYQPKMAALIVRDMKRNLSRLSASSADTLQIWERVVAEHKEMEETKSCPTSRVVTTSPVKERAPLPVGEHKKPILFKKPILPPASLRARRNVVGKPIDVWLNQRSRNRLKE